MLTAVLVVVGAVLAWVLADQWLLRRRNRQPDGPSHWHGSGPGTTIHSNGFEDTVPPLEPVELRRRPGPQR